MQALTSALRSALEEMVESGALLPFHVAVIGRNGAFATLTYTAGEDGLEAHFWYDRIPEGDAGFAVPINAMIVDSRGEARRIEAKAIPERLVGVREQDL